MTTALCCPKCLVWSGDDWSQCKGACPVKVSPHYQPAVEDTFGPLRLENVDDRGRRVA